MKFNNATKLVLIFLIVTIFFTSFLGNLYAQRVDLDQQLTYAYSLEYDCGENAINLYTLLTRVNVGAYDDGTDITLVDVGAYSTVNTLNPVDFVGLKFVDNTISTNKNTVVSSDIDNPTPIYGICLKTQVLDSEGEPITMDENFAFTLEKVVEFKTNAPRIGENQNIIDLATLYDSGAEEVFSDQFAFVGAPPPREDPTINETPENSAFTCSERGDIILQLENDSVCCPAGSESVKIEARMCVDENEQELREFYYALPNFRIINNTALNFQVNAINQRIRSIAGNSCVKSYAICPQGFVNLREVIDKQLVEVPNDSRVNRLSDKLTAYFDRWTYEDEKIIDRLCIDADFEGLIPYYIMPVDTLQNLFESIFSQALLGRDLSSNNRLAATEFIVSTSTPAGIGSDVLRACPNNFFPSQSPDQGTGRFGAWGCCPRGYQYVSQAGASTGPDAQNEGGSACCRIRDRSNPPTAFYGGEELSNPGGRIEINRRTPGCYGTEGILIPQNEENTINESELDVDNDGNLDEGYNRYDILLGTSSFQNSGPVRGYTIGAERFIDDGVGYTEYAPAKQTADFVCPASNLNGCAIHAITTNYSEIVDSNAFNSDPDLNCNYCFSEGEPMRYDVDSQMLQICGREGNEVSIVETPLTNNNIEDTIAEIVELQAVGQQNADLLQQCRERGGLWVAIGCVDVTPFGLLVGLIRIALGVLSGIILAQLIFVGLVYQSGNEEAIQKARDILIATVSGAALIIFSVLALRILGFNILDVVPANFF